MFDIEKEVEALNTFTERCHSWAKARNLHSTDPIKQVAKFVSELRETELAISSLQIPPFDNDDRLQAEIRDGIGDCCVVLCVMTAQLGLPATVIGEHSAWRNRTGVIVPYADHSPSVRILALIGDLADNLLKKRTAEAEAIIPDLFVAMFDLAQAEEVNFLHCLQEAWDEIKDRDGYTFDGVFIKWVDLTELQKEWIVGMRNGLILDSWEVFFQNHDGDPNLSTELVNGEEAATAFARHLLAMGADACSIPVTVEGFPIVVNAKHSRGDSNG